MGSLERKLRRKNPLEAAKNIEKQQKYRDSREQSDKMLFLLHCDGVKTEEVQRSCDNKIMVPMQKLHSMQELHEQVATEDWRVSVGSVAYENKKFPFSFVQCTDCWIDHYRSWMKSGSEDSEELYKKLDPSGRFWDRLRKSDTDEKTAESGEKAEESGEKTTSES